MFTGIIQNQAAAISRKALKGQIRFGFRFVKPEPRKIQSGESIAVDGVCLTVSNIIPQGFEADIVRETLQATTFSRLNKNGHVNTERSLRYGDSLGGHFVTGHVDACAKILKMGKYGKNILLTVNMPPALSPFVALKGSIVADGISLTVQNVSAGAFKVAIVPHTWRVTTLSTKKAGDFVNLEVDLVARYLRRLEDFSRSLPKRSKYKIKVKALKARGF